MKLMKENELLQEVLATISKKKDALLIEMKDKESLENQVRGRLQYEKECYYQLDAKLQRLTENEEYLKNSIQSQKQALVDDLENLTLVETSLLLDLDSSEKSKEEVFEVPSGQTFKNLDDS